MNCVNYDLKDNEPVDVLIRPEDFDIVPLTKASIKTKVTSCIFKGVYYEICVDFKGKEIVLHSFEEVKIGETIGLKVDPYEISLMKISDNE